MGRRFGRQIVTMMIFALVFGGISIAPGSVALAAPILDQQQPTIDTSVGGLAIGFSSQQKLGQTVMAGKTGDLVRVDLPVGCDGADLIIEITDVASTGAPGSTVKSTTTIAGSTLPSFPLGGISFRQFTLATPVAVSSGAVYAIVLRSTSTTATTGCGIFRGPLGDNYTGGDLYFDALPNAPGWIRNCGEFPNDRCDLPFKTWVELTGADLSITKTMVNPSNLNVFAATEQTYELTVANSGPNMATGVTIVDALPANVTLVQAHPACINAAGTLTCTLGPGQANLAAGGSFSIFITVKFNNAGSYTNTASVSANETDPNASNNTSSHTQQVLPTADLLVSPVSATPGVAGPGEAVKYDATVENLGPDPTGDVVLVQTIPAGSTFVSISSPDTTICGPGANASEFGCRFSAIPAGASRTMTVNITAPNSPQGLVTTVTASHVVPPLILDPPSGAPSSMTFLSWVVFESVQQSVASGGTATTDTESDGATSNDPIETTVSGTTGTVTITEQKQSSTAPTNWSIIAVDVVISAPAGTTTSPLFLTFRIDKSFLGQFTAQTVQVIRNNDFVNPVPACQQPVWPTMPSSAVPISPDPCVWKRSTLSDGDVEITVLSSQASVWNFAVHEPFTFEGFAAPVRAGTNDAKARSAVPLKFSLGGFQGMVILADGSPASREISCATGAPLGELTPAALNGGGLHYDETTDTYSLIWRTSKEWSGTCRDLVLTLIDGSDHVARFAFR